MNILITGGAGYIGSHVAEQLERAGHFLIVLDDLSTGYQSSIPTNSSFVQGDFSDENLLSHIFKEYKIESLFHFAALIQADESVSHPEAYYETNFIKSKRLFDFCLNHKVVNFIFSSTAAVYDGSANKPVHEEALLNPSNPYGKSKMMTEIYLQDLKTAHPHINYAILRYFNVAGAKSDLSNGPKNKKTRHLIKAATLAALNQIDQIEVFGTDYPTPDGTCIRDFIHIEDLASAHLLAFDFILKKQKSEIFNCGYEKGYSVLDIINTMKNISDNNFKVIDSPRRLGDPVKVVANAEKIKTLLHWQPKFNDIELICKNSLEWQKKFIDDQQ